eukprot:CFRG8210T1
MLASQVPNGVYIIKALRGYTTSWYTLEISAENRLLTMIRSQDSVSLNESIGMSMSSSRQSLTSIDGLPLLNYNRESRDGSYKNKFNIVTQQDEHYAQTVHDIEDAISLDIHPTRIYQGSSGSYFVRNLEAKITGVFKPKDEEPYGHLNPKWTKWLHKTCCPCIFGRSCLVPNQGYLSEAGASLVDEKLGLRIVPTTRVIKLSSPVFNYPRMTRLYRLFKMDSSLPYKKGSLQLFVNGYLDAQDVIDVVNDPDYNDQQVKNEFNALFERMVVLDYITRNTDRNNDNWLIKILNESSTPIPEVESDIGVDLHTTDIQSVPQPSPIIISTSSVTNGPTHAYNRRSSTPTEFSMDNDHFNIGRSEDSSIISGTNELSACHRMKLAAIDNGLSFPFKHPDSWRTYPYHWVWLPQAKNRFSEEICNYLLPRLTDECFVEELIEEIYQLFKQDSGFSKSHFKRQAAVMRGQILNLTKAMNEKATPLQLVKMPSCVIKKKGQSKFQQFRSRLPWFSNW